LRTRWQSKVGQLALALVAVSLMTTGYLETQIEVTIVVNGHSERFLTHQAHVEAILKEAGLSIYPEDIISPGLEASIGEGGIITVHQAMPVTAKVDGQIIELRTHAGNVAELLQEAGIELGPYDKALLEGQEVNPTENLGTSQFAGESALSCAAPPNCDRLNTSEMQCDDPPLGIAIRRAVPIHMDDGGVPTTVYATQATVGEALRAQNITLHLGDEINPSLSSPASADLHVYILRSKAVDISVDGRLVKTRTREETVNDVLAQEGIALMNKDYTEPRGDAPISDGMDIRVVRMKEEIEIEQEAIPFETAWLPDEGLEIDHQYLEQAGEDGLIKRRFRAIYENGQEMEQTMEDEWVDHEPTTKVIAYGTKIVLRELTTHEGAVKYWRKVRMFATSYTAATCGKSQDHPLYGITRLGWQMGKGIVAVDPRVVNLGSKVYVPGYGLGMAGDTGGKIRGHRIDLGYDEGNLRLWHNWVDVYLLCPPPSKDKIHWVLPNWPRER